MTEDPKIGGRLPAEDEEKDATGTADKFETRDPLARRSELREQVRESINLGAEEEESEYSFEPQPQVMSNLDPQLQHVILASQTGERIDPALAQQSEDGSIRVDVLAVVRDPGRPVPGLEVGRVIGDVVTGSCDVADIEAVRSHPNVISLKGARRVEPELRFSVSEIQGTRDQIRNGLPAGTGGVDGTGVIVGIVDFGCDFAHHNFRRPDGSTRLLFLWDQGRQQNSMSPAGFPFGREFTAADINRALATPDPFAALAYDPGRQSHGTHVMDITAGNGRASGSRGVAPNADIIFVQLAVEQTQPTESFGNSRRLLEAVDYVFVKARELGRRAVVNLSLGTHGGPHDGSTPAERGFDQLLEEPGRAIVIAAGNSFTQRSHCSGTLAPGQTRALGWETFATDASRNELEVWYGGASEMEVTLVTPDGRRIGPARLGDPPALIRRQGVTVGQVIHRGPDPLNGDNCVNIFLEPSMPSGVWGVELRAVGAGAVNFHAWIERDDDARQPDGTVLRNQSRFVAQDDVRTHTLGSISCGRSTIVVGSYDAAVQGRDLSSFTAEGPTRDGKQKPEVSAPGQEIVAAASLSNGGTTTKSGTSMAAPHVAGLVALFMQAARTTPSTATLRQALLASARRNPPAGGGWNSRFGNGRVDCVATLRTQFPAVPQEEPEVEAGVALRGNGYGAPSSLGDFLQSLFSRANNSKVRVKVELEVEPLS